MAVKPAPIDTDAALLDRLNEVRLSQDWSYRQLADDIARVTGLMMSAQTLQPLLSVPEGERSKPYDRTLYKIRKYFEQLDSVGRQHARKRVSA